jgi:hypothetical protein
MQLPRIAAGKRFTLPRPTDRPTPCCWRSLAQARARQRRACWPSSRRAGRRAAPGRRAAVLRARPARGALPRLGDAALRHLQPAPGPDLRAPGHAVAHAHQRRGRGAAAGHHRADAAGATVVPGRHHLPLQAEDAARRGRAEGAADAGRLPARQPGGLARRVRGARRADRPVPDGLAGALPRRPVRRRGRFDPHLRPRQPAQPVPGARGAAAARPRVPDGRGGAHTLPRALAREARRRPDQAPHLQGHGRRASPPPASSTTCRCSSSRPPRSSTTWASRRSWCCTARWTRRCNASGPTRASATASCSTTPSGRSCRPKRSSCAPRTSSPHAAATPRWRCAAASPPTGRGRCPTSAWTAAPPSRWRLEQHLDEHAAPRAAGGRERGPAREPARAAARPPASTCPAWPRWPSSRRATRRSPSPPRRWRQASTGTSPAAQVGDPVHHRDRALRHHAQARRRRKQEQTSSVDALIKDLSELKVGDPVVHANHGIGRYQGLINIDLGDGGGPASSCTWSTPTRPRCTCRWRSCT